METAIQLAHTSSVQLRGIHIQNKVTRALIAPLLRVNGHSHVSLSPPPEWHTPGDRRHITLTVHYTKHTLNMKHLSTRPGTQNLTL